MTLPNHPEKHEEESLTTPVRFQRSVGRADPATRDAPDAVVLTYQSAVAEHVRAEHETTAREWALPADVVVLDETDGRVGVVSDFGIGGPVTALVVEGLVASGVEAFLVTGHAGGLGRRVDADELVVASEAIRDEGTSHHYVPSTARIAPPGDLTAVVREHLTDAGETVHHGPTWTTDAAFRETPGEIERYRDEGVLTVEMEAATAFAVAERRDVAAGAAFAISDYLTPDAWESNHDAVNPHLTRLFDHGVAALDEYVRDR